jgi:hypothetical protein
LIFLTGGTPVVAKPVCFLIRLFYRILLALAYRIEALLPISFPTGWRLLGLLSAVLLAYVLTTFFFRKKQSAVALSIAVAFSILVIGQYTYRMTEKNCFLVTILGEKKQMVVVVSYQNRTDVIDITGNHRNPELVAAYTTEQGIRRLNALCLTKHAQQMRVAYPETANLEIQQAIVPTDCVLSENTTIAGVTPLQLDEFVLTDPAFSITWQEDMLSIVYGTMAFCIGTSMTEIPQGEWQAVICTSWNPKTDSAPDFLYLKETSIQLRVTQSGTWSLTELR